MSKKNREGQEAKSPSRSQPSKKKKMRGRRMQGCVAAAPLALLSGWLRWLLEGCGAAVEPSCLLH